MSFSGSWQERYLEGQQDLISRLVMGIAAVPIWSYSMESRGYMNYCVSGSLNPKQPELLGLRLGTPILFRAHW